MTSRCEFGHGNHGLARAAMGTVSVSNHLAVAAQMRIHRPQRKRTRCSIESAIWKVEWVTVPRRQYDAFNEAREEGVASTVSRRRYVERVVQPNLGDHMVSSVVTPPFCGVALVDSPISVRSEEASDAPCGVGGARITCDCRDSITQQEGRGPTWRVPARSPWTSPFPERGRRFVP